MTPDYSYWQNALAGTFAPVHDGHPQPGFYRAKNKDRKDDPVAIWHDGTKMVAMRAGAPVEPDVIWTWVCRSPVTHEEYIFVANGGAWPDDIADIPQADKPMPGSNNPPEGEQQADEIQSAIDAALAELKKPVVVQADCDRLANHKDRLTKLYKAQEAERKAKKQPHLDAGNAVDAAFKPVLAKIEEAGDKLKKAITAFLMKEEQRRRAEAAALMAQQEAARKAAEAANLPPPEPAPLPEVNRPKAGTAGRAVSLRTYKSAVITDYAKALQHFAENAEVRELIQTLADRAARADIAVPGCEIHSEQRAA